MIFPRIIKALADEGEPQDLDPFIEAMELQDDIYRVQHMRQQQDHGNRRAAYRSWK